MNTTDYNNCAEIFNALKEPERIALLKDLLIGPRSFVSAKKTIKNAYACFSTFEKLGLIEEISQSNDKNKFVWEMYADIKPYVAKVIEDFDEFEKHVGNNPVWDLEEKYVVASMLSNCLHSGERFVVFNTLINSPRPLTYDEIQTIAKIPEYHRVGLFCRDLCKMFFVREAKANNIKTTEQATRKNEKAFYVNESLKKLCKPICDDVNTLTNNNPHKPHGKIFYNIPDYRPHP